MIKFFSVFFLICSVAVAQPAPPLNLRIDSGFGGTLGPLEPPPSSGSGIAAPTQWTLVDDRTPDADVVQFDISQIPEVKNGYELSHYEVAISSATTGTRIQRVLGGGAIDYVRRLKTNVSGERTRFWARSVQEKKNEIKIDIRNFVPLAGQTVIQKDTGARARIVHVVNTLGGKKYDIVIDNISNNFGGSFDVKTDIEIAGFTGYQASEVYPTRYLKYQEYLYSEWSSFKEITPQNGSAQVTITASKTNLIEGEGTILEASVSGSGSLRPVHDLHYRWYVTKAGEQGDLDALPDYFNVHFSKSRTEGYGSMWAFVPKTTGSTVVNVEVRDRSGVIATKGITLNTTPLTNAFSAAETFVVSTSGNFSGAPSGAQHFTNLTDAYTAIPSGSRALVLLRSGETFTSSVSRLDAKNLDTFVLTSYGSGERPTHKGTIALDSNVSVINGVNFISYYDPTDPMGVPDLGLKGPSMNRVGHSTVANSYLAGYNVTLELSNPGNTSIIYNTEITDWGNFAVFQGDTGAHALIGCYLHQNPRTWRGGGKGEKVAPFLADHGPFRSSRPTANRVISKLVAFSTNSWGGEDSVQSPLRLFGNGITEKPYRTVLSEVITEGGNASFGVSARGGGKAQPTPKDIVAEKFIHITSTQPTAPLGIQYGGTTLRNFILVQPNSPRETSTAVRTMINVSNLAILPGADDNENNPINIINGTIVDLRDANNNYKNRSFSPLNVSSDGPMQVNVSNVLEYAPEMPDGVTDTLPLEVSPNWTPEYLGRFIWSVGTPDFSYATDPEATASFKPLPGSSAYKSASGSNIPVDDIAGTLRTGSTSKGAFH